MKERFRIKSIDPVNYGQVKGNKLPTLKKCTEGYRMQSVFTNGDISSHFSLDSTLK